GCPCVRGGYYETVLACRLECPSALEVLPWSKTMHRLATLLVAVVPFSISALAQQPCQPPQVLTASGQKNIFTDEQEVDLGDAIAENMQHEYRIIEDEEVTAHLSRIGNRIVKHLPPNKLQFRFTLVDLPEANAFV